MGLGLERDDALDRLHLEVVGGRLVFRCKLLDHRTLGKRHVVAVGRDDLARMLLGRLLDQREEARLALLAVNDKLTAEDLVAAVLRVDLREAEDLRVGERTPVLLLDLVQIFYLFRTQGEAFLLIVFLDVLHVLDRLWLVVDGEDRLVQSFVHTLEHAVVVSILTLYGEVLLNTRNAGETHVLCDLNGISTPRGYHFAARAYKEAFELRVVQQCGVTIKPAEGLLLLVTGLVVDLSGNDVLLGSLEEKNHNL